MKAKRTQIILSILSIFLSIYIGTIFIDGNDEFINESNGSTGKAFSDFIMMFIFFELLFMSLIWGIPTLFNKKKE